jgi:effector-binding domain-containing protein
MNQAAEQLNNELPDEFGVILKNWELVKNNLTTIDESLNEFGETLNQLDSIQKAIEEYFNFQYQNSGECFFKRGYIMNLLSEQLEKLVSDLNDEYYLILNAKKLVLENGHRVSSKDLPNGHVLSTIYSEIFEKSKLSIETEDK